MKTIYFLINKLEKGGAQKVFIDTISLLQGRGHCVKIVYLFGQEKDEDISFAQKMVNVDKIFLNAKSIFDIKKIFYFRSILVKENVDVLYSTLNESNVFAKLVKLFYIKTKVFVREANIATPKPLKYKILDWALNFFVEKIICVSSQVRESNLRYQSIHKQKMVVLMNSVEIPATQKKYPSHLSVPLKIINVGGLTPKKGQINLIRSVMDVLAVRPNSIQLEIYGTEYGGNYKSVLEKEFINSKYSNNIVIFDGKPDMIERGYLSNDVFVLSSLYEGCPNVLLEAMSYGLASISTKVSGSEDIIQEGRNGFLVEVNSIDSLTEKIIYCLDNFEILKQYGFNARESMKKDFSRSIYIEKLMNIFNQV